MTGLTRRSLLGHSGTRERHRSIELSRVRSRWSHGPDLAALLHILELKTEQPASVALLNTWIAKPKSSVGPGQAV